MIPWIFYLQVSDFIIYRQGDFFFTKNSIGNLPCEQLSLFSLAITNPAISVVWKVKQEDDY